MVAYTRYRTEWSGLNTTFMRAWPARTAVVPAFAGVKNIDVLEREIAQLINDSKLVGRRLPLGVNALAAILARADQKFSMDLSAGPVDPQQVGLRLTGHRFVAGPGGVERQPIYSPTAWKIPVRRITSRYYHGWMVRRLAPGVWMVYNPTREAYYIEYGIHVSPRRVRRPIRKLAYMKTLRFADQNKIGHLVWEFIYGPLRGPGSMSSKRGTASTGMFTQSPGVMPFMGSGFSL